ncbi:GNAT family N-acetyltransferase [Streptosporangium sandarakinum]
MPAPGTTPPEPITDTALAAGTVIGWPTPPAAPYAERMLNPSYPLRTDRLTLRPFTEDDLHPLHAIHRLPEVARYLYGEAHDLEQTRAALAKKITSAALTDEGQALSLAVQLTTTGELVGDATLFWHSRTHRSGEIGYVFHPGHHGNGYATETARVLLRLGFEELGLHRITGRLDGRNHASARVLERLGMRREAHLVENEFVKGEWTDEVIYAMLRREWDAHPLTKESR